MDRLTYNKGMRAAMRVLTEDPRFKRSEDSALQDAIIERYETYNYLVAEAEDEQA